MMRPHYLRRQIWGWPIALAVLASLGLVLALFDDQGPLDVSSWFALGSLVAVCLRFGLVKTKTRT